MRTQRAIRRLKPDPVDDALVLRLIELALKAPTGSNAQNWEFVVVKDPAVKAKFAELGFFTTGSTPEGYHDKLAFETERWTRVVKENNIKVEG